MTIPRIVSQKEWQAARDALLVKEKQLTRAIDALAAERRRLPMVEFDSGHAFDGPAGEGSGGPANLLDLFAGRRQLIVYHFMLEPGTTQLCSGCASIADSIGPLGHLHARDTSLVLVSPAPLAQIEPHRRRMGWAVPWYSSYPGSFNAACGVGSGFGLSVFLRHGDRAFRSYFTTARGVDRLRYDLSYLDLTPLGRQETWEDSPEGWPQTPPYRWWRLHDEYETV